MIKNQGLFEIGPGGPGPVELSTKKTLEELSEAGLLTGKYLAMAAVLESAATALDRGLTAPKVSVATTTIMKTLVETLDELPEPLTGQDPYYDALDATLHALTEEALSDRRS